MPATPSNCRLTRSTSAASRWICPAPGRATSRRARTGRNTYADQVSGFLGAIGVERAHVVGVSLGAGVGMHLAARHPERVRTLSLHSAWDRSDDYLRTVVGAVARAGRRVAHRGRRGHPRHLPLLLHAGDVRRAPEFVQALDDFVRGRPAQPLEAFLSQTDAALAHDASAALGQIQAPTQVTFGAHDLVTSTRFADRLIGPITRRRADRVRPSLPRRPARGRRGVQPLHARLPAAPPRLALRARRRIIWRFGGVWTRLMPTPSPSRTTSTIVARGWHQPRQPSHSPIPPPNSPTHP